MSDRFNKSVLLAKFDAIFESAQKADTRLPLNPTDIKRASTPVHPILYLPIEVKARELEAKAMIAREAADKGLRVFLGASWVLNAWAPFLPPGIVLFKSTNGLDVDNMMKWSQQGSKIAVLDEEAFGITASPHYIAATTHPYIPALADLVCAQGPAYAQAFPYPANIKVTGNPRTKTYKPSQGDNILVCLQSGNINNNGRSFEDMVTVSLGITAPLSSAEGKAWAQILRESIAQECDVLPVMMETIATLADAFPERRIVVRPHPVEDPKTWTFNKPNVVFDTNNSVIESLQQAAVLVYVSGCTTGLDAYLAGVPAVRLGTGHHGISARMHVGVKTAAEAVKAVETATPWQGDISDHFAAVNITSHLVQLYKDNPATGTASIDRKPKVVPAEFHQRKFPDTSAQEIGDLVGRPVQQVAWNTFTI